MRLTDKVALITGSGWGIGRAEAILFAKEGAKVVVNDVDAAAGEETLALIKQEGGQATFVLADVSKSSEAEMLIQSAVKNFGKLDILVNNAGVGLHREGDCPVAELSEEVWKKTLDTNLNGVFFCCKFAIQEMLKQGGGAIVNTSSTAALFGSNANAYSASKGGVVALTRSIAFSYGPKKIRANAICPGFIDTPLLHKILPDQETLQRVIRKFPLRVVGKPDDCAYAALYFASDESAFVTGSVIVVDGGMTSHY